MGSQARRGSAAGSSPCQAVTPGSRSQPYIYLYFLCASHLPLPLLLLPPPPSLPPPNTEFLAVAALFAGDSFGVGPKLALQ